MVVGDEGKCGTLGPQDKLGMTDEGKNQWHLNGLNPSVKP